ncbi:MAG: cell division protein FtsQ/DivIB [Rickettsiaceae bacterium]
MSKNSKINIKQKAITISFKRKIALLYFRIKLVLQITIIGLICAFCFTKAFATTKLNIRNKFDEVTARLGFDLKDMIITGYDNASVNHMLTNFKNKDKISIFAIDINELKYHILTDPWVKKVEIQRKLPHILYINITEREPIAIWQINKKLYLIDNEGYKITSNLGKFSNLPHIVGKGANIYANTMLMQINNYPMLQKNFKSAVRYGERRWDLYLGSIIVKMPEKDFLEALEYVSKIDLDNCQFKMIDLRDSNKFYITKS